MNTPIFISNSEIPETLIEVKIIHNLSDNRYKIINNSVFGYNNIVVPISIFRGRSCASALVWFLKKYKLSFSEIAKILNRDPRTIWSLYNKLKKHDRLKKQKKEFEDKILVQNEEYYVPVDIFSYRGLSVLESVVFWLKTEKDLSYSYISKLLGKNYQTIRTVYLRSLNKVGLKYE
ncbi:MAG: hypothetical protein QXL18_03665 [Candidatus Woesearchaeota archaeon]